MLDVSGWLYCLRHGNALQAASVKGNADTVSLLLDNEADVNAQGGVYGNALQAASVNGNADIVRLLLDKRADVNAQGGIYCNALQAASAMGNAGIVSLLLDRGADVNAQGSIGTALQAARWHSRYPEIERLLLCRAANPL